MKNKKLKIALITNRFYPEIGGSEINIYNIACELSRQNDVYVFCPRRIKVPKKEKMDNFTVHRLRDFFNWNGKFPNLKAKTLCPQIIFYLLKGKFDIIQCYPSLNYNNILAFFVAKLLKIPFIFCSFDFLDYASIIAKQKIIDTNILNKYTPSFREVYILKHCNKIFSISEKELAFFQKYNRSAEYSHVSILSKEFEQPNIPIKIKYNLTEKNFVFLCLGRVSYIKGQDVALAAFLKARHEFPDAKLIFVGRHDYEPEFYYKLLRSIENENIKNHVIFTGVQDRKGVIAWLRSADIHVIPVRFMNSGAVVVETWMSNTPVLQSDVVDPNLVIEDYNGYLFRSGDIDDLSKKMIKAFRSKIQLQELAKNGNALVKKKYTYTNLINLYNKAYEQLLL
jgi:glycosyltransferase involved in cell wall biosynthesis